MVGSFNKAAKHKRFPVNFVKFPISCFLPPLVAASENLRGVFVQQFFCQQLKLCLHLIHFHSSKNVFKYLTTERNA